MKDDILTQALINFNTVQDALQIERAKCTEARRFCWVKGAQWESWGAEQFENKPMFEINKSQLAVTRINNEYRENRISVTFLPEDGTVSEESTESLNSLYRDSEKSSSSAYIDNAFLEGITGGIGAWRVRSEYEDDYSDDNDFQEIKFEPIYDADSSVFFDLGSKRQNKSDATECWVISSIPKKQYIEKYEDNPASWPKYNYLRAFDWTVNDVVYIGEYYHVEEKTEIIRWFGSITGDEKRVTPDQFKDADFMDELTATGYTLSRKKPIKRLRVHKYIMSGGKILEDCGYIAGPRIPIVIYYAKYMYIDNIERASGHIEVCMDSQRLLNMQRSKLAEISSLSSIEKPIFYPAQVLGHEHRWAQDNIQNYPYMLINPTYDQNGQFIPGGQVGSTKAPELPPAMAALLQLTDTDLGDLLGNQQNGEMVKSNQGDIATELIQSQIAMQTSGYMSNLAIALEWSAKIWLGMAKELYVDPGRKMKGVTTSDKPKQIELMKPTIASDGSIDYENNFVAIKNMDVVVEIGPSSASKRSATEKGLVGLLRIVPDQETQAVLSSMIMANSEGEGMGELRPYFRDKLIKLGAITPTKDEAAKIADQQKAAADQPAEPDANTKFLEASATEAEAKAQNYKAQTLKILKEVEQVHAQTQLTLANAKKAEADALSIVAELDMAKREHFMDTVERLGVDESQPEPATEAINNIEETE